MKLDVLDKAQIQEVRKWRNEELQFLRTPYRITEQMQDKFIDNVINDRDSNNRYFAIIEPEVKNDGLKAGSNQEFIGMGGLTNIEWENGCAEISLIINPEYRGKGYGMKAVKLLLEEAFNSMRLYSVYGEVYDCGNRGFWEKVVKEYSGYKTDLKNKKFYNGLSYDSMWFSVKG